MKTSPKLREIRTLKYARWQSYVLIHMTGKLQVVDLLKQATDAGKAGRFSRSAHDMLTQVNGGVALTDSASLLVLELHHRRCQYGDMS